MSRVRPAIVVGVLAGLVLLAHLVSFGVPYRYREILDVLHVTGFAVLTIFFLSQAGSIGRRMQWSRAAAALAILAATAGFSIVAEALQAFTARDASPQDLVRDFCGIAAGGFVIGVVWSAGWRAALQGALASACLAAVLWEPGRALFATASAAARMPELMSFESSLDELLYRSTNSQIARVPSGSSWPEPGMLAEVSARSGYSGISLPRLPPDWSEYQSVSVVLAGRDPGITGVTIRIHDYSHNDEYDDRFNRLFEVGTEPRRITVPLVDIRTGPRNRELDLSRIQEVMIFVRADEASGFLIDDLRLE